MKLKVYNICQLIFSSAEDGLWWDSDKHHDGTGKKGYGNMLKLRGGWVLRPVKKFWLSREGNNPWD